MEKKTFYLAIFISLLAGAGFLALENPGVRAEEEETDSNVVSLSEDQQGPPTDDEYRLALEAYRRGTGNRLYDHPAIINKEKFISDRKCVTSLDTENCLSSQMNEKNNSSLSSISQKDISQREEEARNDYQEITEEEMTAMLYKECDPKILEAVLEEKYNIYPTASGTDDVAKGCHKENSPCLVSTYERYCYKRLMFGGCVFLQAYFKPNISYNIYFTEQETDKPAKNNLCLCGALRLHIDPPEGEWFISGGEEDSPPITWVDDAQKDYQQAKPINLYEYELSEGPNLFFGTSINKKLGIDCDEKSLECTIYPKFGVAATNPLTSGKIKVEANDKFEVVQKEGEYYLVPKKIGMGEVTVTISDLPAYTSLDNIWFQKGNLPGTTKTFKFSITESGNKE